MNGSRQGASSRMPDQKSPRRDWLNRGSIAIGFILLIYTAIIILREPRFFLLPRFWGEEGTLHFISSYYQPIFSALFQPETGYLNLWANLSTILAVHLTPLELAPLITTIMAFLAQLMLGAWVLTSPVDFLQKIYQKVLLLCVVLFLPLTSEVWLNTINSIEITALISFLILIEPTHLNGFRKWAAYCLLFFAGCTGPFSLFLIPFFLVKARLEKLRQRLIQSLILVGCGVIQLFLILTTTQKGSLGFRLVGIINFTPGNIVLITWTQSIGLISVGYNQMLSLVAQFEKIEVTHLTWARILVVGLLLLQTLYLFYWSLKLSWSDRFIYLGGYLTLLILSIFFSVDRDKSVLIQPGYAQRHFYLPNVILGLILLRSVDWSALSRWKFRSIASTLLLAVGIVAGITTFESTLYRYPAWPSWQKEVAVWRADPRVKLAIWPEGWYIKLNK